VLDLPDVVDAGPVREFDLVEGVLIEAALGIIVPGAAGRPWQLMLVEQAEFHGLSSSKKPLSRNAGEGGPRAKGVGR